MLSMEDTLDVVEEEELETFEEDEGASLGLRFCITLGPAYISLSDFTTEIPSTNARILAGKQSNEQCARLNL